MRQPKILQLNRFAFFLARDSAIKSKFYGSRCSLGSLIRDKKISVGQFHEIPTKIFNKNPDKNRNKSPSPFILHSSFFILSLPFLQELDERIDILVVAA